MKKIPTLFLRDFEDMRRVTPAVNPLCTWVLDGEGVATCKYDGTCVMFDGTAWWARREVKPGKQPPPDFRPIETDAVTGKTVGWEPIEQSAFAKYHAEVLRRADPEIPTGTYELVGPKINGNPQGFERHMLVRHESGLPDEWDDDPPRDFDGLAEWLADFDGEGIVWHHPDGRMAKIKRRDFPS